MKILASADYHLKLNTKNIPNDWARNRYQSLFNKMHTLEKQCDISIIMGDFFDKLPTLEELELYYEFVSECRCPTYIISGNHEAIKKDTTFMSYLKNITSRLNKDVKIIDSYHTIMDSNGKNLIDFIHYNKLKDTLFMLIKTVCMAL
jgi:DNA repair exonuclease SbcCD nuclease subunit